MSKPYCINCGMRHAQRAGGDWDCEIDSGTVMELQRKQIAALKAEVERLRNIVNHDWQNKTAAKIEVLREVLTYIGDYGEGQETYQLIDPVFVRRMLKQLEASDD